MEIRPVAIYHGELPSKFGIPRQSGLVPSLRGRIVFEPEFRNREALRGLEGFDRIWLVWEFSGNRPAKGEWQPTVRPPRLGGNTRMGVFATRSPFRPNPIGLSCVRLLGIDYDTPEGAVLRVAGADLMDGTPIYDIKPYLPYADCHPGAAAGFAGTVESHRLEVSFPEALLAEIPEDKRAALFGILEQDPRPGYRRGESGRRYGVAFAGMDVRFVVEGDVLRVVEVVKG